MSERSDNTNVSKPIINPILAQRKYQQVVSDLEDELNIKQKGVLPLNTLQKLKQQKEANTNTVVKQDNRSEAKRQYDQMRGEQVREANTRLKAYEKSGIDNVARYVPIAGTYALQGQVDLLKQSGRKEEARELSPWVAVSAAGDLATIAAGARYPIPTATSIAGAAVGGNIGRHYGNEFTGSLAGGFVGGRISIFYNTRPVQLYRLSKELNKSTRNTKLINKDIEVVSPYGVTQGSGLNTYSKYDVGFHFSPRWSPTSIAIQKQTGAPFIRTGYQLTSENIPYIIAKDKGIWTSQYNPELYRGVNPGNTPLENVIALDQIGPNYKYTNLFESRGNSSYFTTDGNSINLSKNILATSYERPLKGVERVVDIGVPEIQYVTNLNQFGKSYTGYVGDQPVILSPHRNEIEILSGNTPRVISSESYDEYLKSLQKLHDEYVSKLQPLDKELYLSHYYVPDENPVQFKRGTPVDKLVRERIKQLTDDFYNSDEYIERYVSRLGLPEILAKDMHKELIKTLNDIQDNTVIGVFHSNNTSGQQTLFRNNDTGEYIHRLSLSTGVPYYSPKITTHHEFGHSLYNVNRIKDIPAVKQLVKANDELIGDAEKHLISKGNLSEEQIAYYTDKDELRQRVIPVVEEMFENGWTAEDAFEKSIALKRSNLKDLFNKDYIIKLLEGMLVMSPLIASNNE